MAGLEAPTYARVIQLPLTTKPRKKSRGNANPTAGPAHPQRANRQYPASFGSGMVFLCRDLRNLWLSHFQERHCEATPEGLGTIVPRRSNPFKLSWILTDWFVVPPGLLAMTWNERLNQRFPKKNFKKSFAIYWQCHLDCVYWHMPWWAPYLN